MRGVKGRTARRINLALGRTGMLWQREWFDRWMRDDDEWERSVAYIHQNPVKAGLARSWQDHLWTK
jgi:REP element-mobilizing transposase RayT